MSVRVNDGHLSDIEYENTFNILTIRKCFKNNPNVKRANKVVRL